MVRRALALGAGLLVLILLALGIRGCLNSRHRGALKSYDRDVSALARESHDQVAKPFFALLSNKAGNSPIDLEVKVNQFRVLADQQSKRAHDLSVPGEMAGAQRDLLLALGLRAGALAKVANRVRTALSSGPGADDAFNQIAGEMEVFLTSDVLFSQRIAPLIADALNSNGIHGEPAVDGPRARFLADLSWLSSGTVKDRLVNGSGAQARKGPVAPGVHGHRLDGVSLGGKDLTPGTTNRISTAGGTDFTVKITNDGVNAETGVMVTVRLSGSGSPITATKTIDRTKPGVQASAVVPLGTTPPTGVPLTLTASIGPVPGEKTFTHNKQTYTVTFTK